MNLSKSSILILIFAVLASNALAQKTFNNSVKLQTGGFYIKDRYSSKKMTSLIGASYERRVYKNLVVSVGYSQWKFWFPGKKLFIAEPLKPLDTAYGTLMERSGYKMIDVAALYRLNVYKHRHFVKLGLGISNAWGKNERIQQMKYDPDWYYDTYTTYTEKASYWGIVPQISYDYLFLRNRINAGIDLRGRYYSGIPQHQYDYGVHVGVNF